MPNRVPPHHPATQIRPRLLYLGLIIAVVLGILAAPAPSTPDHTALAAPAPQSDERVKSVSVGWEHVCALMETGAVRCWGSNSRNQTNVPSDLGAVRQISAGFFHTCAVTQAGELRCWGSSSRGMDIPPDLGSVAYVSAGAEVTCAITTSGTLRCWGDPTVLYGQPTDIGPVIDVTVSHSIPGTGAICATTTAGLIRCWGNLISADVLDSRAVYTNPDLREQVIIGGMYVCVIGADKLLRCGSEDEPIDFGMVSQGSMDIGDNICAVTVDGTLRCEDINVPADIGSVRQVSTWQAYTCAVTTNGGLRCWENKTNAELVNIAGSGAAGTGNTTTIPASELPTGLVYNAGGQQYQVHLDTNSVTTIGTAPPARSILGPENTRLWIEMADPQGNQEPFQILQANVDGSNQHILLDSSTFYQQFPDYISLYYTYSTGMPPTLVINSDKSQIFFPACQQGMGESAICTMFQFDLNSRTVNRLTWLHFESSPAWIHPDKQRAIESWDLACTGSLRSVSNEPKPLSGMPVSVVWLADMSFVYSRYICKGIWDEESVTPQYDIILAHADGSDNRVLVPGMVASDMVLSPDKQTLAFITSDPGKLHFGEVALWVINLDGTGLRKVLNLPQDATDLHWYTTSIGNTTTPDPVIPSPTTGEIAYIQDGNIYLLNLANGHVTPLVTDGTVEDWRAQLTWSPDGRRLAYASNRAGNYDIYVLDVESGNTEQISSDPLDEYLPSFAPDGSLFFVRIVEEYIKISGGTWLLIHFTDGEEESMITKDSDGFISKMNILPDNEILTIVDHGTAYGILSTGKKDIIWDYNNRTCPSPGGEHSAIDAKWSHDGAALAVVAADCPADYTESDWGYTIFLIDADNPNAEPRRFLGNENSGSSLDWSPDSEWLVYERGGLWLVHANGGTPQRISTVGASPAWRPDATGGSVEPTVAPTIASVANPQPIATTIPGNAAVSCMFTRRMVNPDGNATTYMLIRGATCGSTTANPTTVNPAHYITILNTPSATLTDQLGNTTDAISGTLSLPVPNASYYVLGERAHMFVAPADQEYTLILPVSSEPMFLELRTGTGDTTSSTVRYSDLNFPLTTTAALTISPQGDAELRYDSDGDSTFDTLVPPTVSVIGAASNDLAAPTVKIDVSRQGWRWMATITAEDVDSGVKQILYSTDDQHYQFYTEPFEVNPADGTTFYAFADDNMANRSGVVTYTLTPRALWDLPGYIGLALLSLVLIGGVVLARRSMARPPLTGLVFLGAILFLLALLILALFLIIPPLLGSISRSEPSIAPTSAARSNTEAVTSVAPSPVPTLPAPTADAAMLVTSPTNLPTSTPSEARVVLIPDPPIISRSEWGATAPGTGFIPHTPARIVLSHEARSCCDDALAARVRSNQSVHMNNGWPDIAYHYTIAPDGSIFAGRDVGFESDSSYTAVNPTYQLNGTIVIGILGNYDSQTPTPESLRSIRWLMAWLCQTYNISPDDLYPLSQVAPNNPFGENPTTSPGGNMPPFTVFRSDVRAILAGEMAP